MTYVISALTFTTALFFSLEGSIYGTYTLLLLLGLHIILCFVYVSLLSVLNMKIEIEKNTPNFLSSILVQVFVAITIYHLYNIGYVFFAGVAIFPLVVSFVSNINTYIDQENEL